MKKIIFIEGMSCGHCVAHVNEALVDLGAKDVEVSLEKKVATAEMSENITDDAIKLIIEDAGYEVIEIKLA